MRNERKGKVSEDRVISETLALMQGEVFDMLDYLVTKVMVRHELEKENKQ